MFILSLSDQPRSNFEMETQKIFLPASNWDQMCTSTHNITSMKNFGTSVNLVFSLWGTVVTVVSRSQLQTMCSSCQVHDNFNLLVNQVQAPICLEAPWTSMCFLDQCTKIHDEWNGMGRHSVHFCIRCGASDPQHIHRIVTVLSHWRSTVVRKRVRQSRLKTRHSC